MTEQEKKEKVLAVELAAYLGPDLFKQLSVDNPRTYLTSTRYKAV
jgi:hypothetical protein